MNEITNKNKLFVVKEYEFDTKDIHEIDCLLNDVIKHCRKNYFHTFDYRLVYDINFTNISNNEEVNLIVTHRSMEFKTEFYGLNKKIKNARRNNFKFNQINNFKIEIYSNLSYIDIHYHLKLGAPLLHRQFFKKLAQNRDYIRNHCNDFNNSFHFACRQWYSYSNPGILTCIHIQILV